MWEATPCYSGPRGTSFLASSSSEHIPPDAGQVELRLDYFDIAMIELYVLLCPKAETEEARAQLLVRFPAPLRPIWNVECFANFGDVPAQSL